MIMVDENDVEMFEDENDVEIIEDSKGNKFMKYNGKLVPLEKEANLVKSEKQKQQKRKRINLTRTARFRKGISKAGKTIRARRAKQKLHEARVRKKAVKRVRFVSKQEEPFVTGFVGMFSPAGSKRVGQRIQAERKAAIKRAKSKRVRKRRVKRKKSIAGFNERI